MTYQKIIRAKGESNITGSLEVKKRILANEVTYRCLCEGWTDARCASQ